ncbi:Chaperonin 60 [Spironucleus salmonicida]|uniref:Chaperonin 60 n=1 Tax=Spironucleus salmonicida TaxID=348837 RepID=K7RUJ0_9EUKA|nr:chaperonin 60 [Spironucleus salmonicida]KAH0576857.1 Chaperonin 60 [Spironucleus salmonicida]|eukprot:EST45258.1 Chaperonin 60 [Spironucleus salmonicida]
MTLALIQKQSQELANLVTSTLGPRGRSILISRPDIGEPARLTKDGATVARSYNKQTPGAQLLKEASQYVEQKAGDGTTTATLLANELIQLQALNYEESQALIRAGNDAIDFLQSIADKVSSIKNVALTSLNGDIDGANMISEAYEICGSVQVTNGTEDSLKIITGARFESGWLSPYFCLNHQGKSITYDHPIIFAVDGVLEQPDQLIQALETASQNDSPLVVIASDVTGQALSLLIANHIKSAVKCVAVRSPGFGNVKSTNIQDISLMSQGKPITIKNAQLATIGKCQKFTTDDRQFFINFEESAQLSAQKQSVQKELRNQSSPFMVSQINDRISRLNGKIAEITVGGASEISQRERRDRFDDAIGACRAASQKGVVAGGGSALLQASSYILELTSGNKTDNKMRKILSDVLKKQLYKICENSGISGLYIEEKLRNQGLNAVYDVVKNEIGSFQELGIVDPVDVCCEAIRSAVQLASQVLRVGGSIIDEERK